MKQFSIIRKTPVWLSIGAVVMIGSLFMFFSHLRPSIQFTGWMEVVVDQEVDDASVTRVQESLTAEWYEALVSRGTKDGFWKIVVQQEFASNDEVSVVTSAVQDALLDGGTIQNKDQILELSIIWPSIGDYITRSAKSALIRGTVLMAVYILFAFSGMRKVISPLLLAVVTIVTMIFDVSFASWIYGISMAMNPAIQVDTIFIIALLTVMWYSINDTIVIFDRIRENTLDYLDASDEEESNKKKKKAPKKAFNRQEVFDTSLWQTMRRSLATSISTLLVIAAMYIFGTGILKMFAFTLWMWVIAGTYSSIFVAAPLAYFLSGGMQSDENGE